MMSTMESDHRERRKKETLQRFLCEAFGRVQIDSYATNDAFYYGRLSNPRMALPGNHTFLFSRYVFSVIKGRLLLTVYVQMPEAIPLW